MARVRVSVRTKDGVSAAQFIHLWTMQCNLVLAAKEQVEGNMHSRKGMFTLRSKAHAFLVESGIVPTTSMPSLLPTHSPRAHGGKDVGMSLTFCPSSGDACTCPPQV